jgi:hypothetical protein
VVAKQQPANTKFKAGKTLGDEPASSALNAERFEKKTTTQADENYSVSGDSVEVRFLSTSYP